MRSRPSLQPKSRSHLKGGRPALPPKLRLSKVLRVRVLPEDQAAVIASAAAVSLDLPTYMRHLLFSRRIPEVASAPTLAMVQQLSKLGNNLNQLTRLVHTGRVNPRLEPLLEEIRDQIQAFHRQILGLHDRPPG